jgi:hypothetical protein
VPGAVVLVVVAVAAKDLLLTVLAIFSHRP